MKQVRQDHAKKVKTEIFVVSCVKDTDGIARPRKS